MMKHLMMTLSSGAENNAQLRQRIYVGGSA